jgi:hypothetical protein
MLAVSLLVTNHQLGGHGMRAFARVCRRVIAAVVLRCNSCQLQFSKRTATLLLQMFEVQTLQTWPGAGALVTVPHVLAAASWQRC